MRHVFASVAKPAELGYTMDHCAMYELRNYSAALFGRCFLTYGHGLVQHSADAPIQPEQLTDYLHSLAIVAHADPELQDVLATVWPKCAQADRRDVRFAASVRFKEDKPQWYCLGERKVSSSSSKGNLRNWEKVVDWMDGRPLATNRLLGGRYVWGNDLLSRYLLAERIYRVQGEEGEWQATPQDVLKLPLPGYRLLADAVDACASLVALVNARKSVVDSMEYLENNYRRIQKSEEDARVAAVIPVPETEGVAS